MGIWADNGEPAPEPATAESKGTYPPVGWPTLGQLTYTKELITVLVLALALPWLLKKVTRDPAGVLAGVGRRSA